MSLYAFCVLRVLCSSFWTMHTHLGTCVLSFFLFAISLTHSHTHTCKVCACPILIPFLFMTHTGKCDGGKWNHSLLMGRTQRAWFSPLASEVTLMTSYKWIAAVCTGRVLSEILCCFCKWERQNVPQYLYPDRLFTKFVSRVIILLFLVHKKKTTIRLP